MDPRLKETPENLQELIDSQADFIVGNQLSSGAIPWYRGGVTDPWDHVEGAIALDFSGRFKDRATRPSVSPRTSADLSFVSSPSAKSGKR